VLSEFGEGDGVGEDLSEGGGWSQRSRELKRTVSGNQDVPEAAKRGRKGGGGEGEEQAEDGSGT